MAKSTKHIDNKKIKTVSGSITESVKFGDAAHYLVVNVLVSGDNYDQVAVTFANKAGLFPNEPICLDTGNPIQRDLILMNGLMTVNIGELTMVPPAESTPGSLSLDGNWTDENGGAGWASQGYVTMWRKARS